MPETLGWQQTLRLRREDLWGVPSATYSAWEVPFAQYSVRPLRRMRFAQLFAGLRQQKHASLERSVLSGRLAAPLWPHFADGTSLAQQLLEWGNQSSLTQNAPSYTAFRIEPAAPHALHTGLRVDSMLLWGDVATGAVWIQLQLLGIAESTTESIGPQIDAPQRIVPFPFSEVALCISPSSGSQSSQSDSSEQVPIRSFRLAIENNLYAYHVRSIPPSALVSRGRAVSLQLEVHRDSEWIDELRRADAQTQVSAALVLRGHHLGTASSGTRTLVECRFENLAFENASDRVGLKEPRSQDARWIAIKSDGSAGDLTFEFSTN